MAEEESCEDNQQEEECLDLEGTQQFTDCSQGRGVTSSVKQRPESGYHEDARETEQPFEVPPQVGVFPSPVLSGAGQHGLQTLSAQHTVQMGPLQQTQAITKMEEKMSDLCGSQEEFKEVMQMAMAVHNEGRREGRREALGEVEQQKLAYHQMREEMGQFMQDTLERWEKLHQTLTTLMPMVCGDTLISLNEVASRRQLYTELSSTEPVSPMSSCSGETRFDTADEWREEPRPNTTPRSGQGRYLSSSDEERKCKSNGLELHPQKLPASQKKKEKM